MQHVEANLVNNSYPTTHFFDVFTAQLFHADGEVFNVGKPEDYYPDVLDDALERMERVLKLTGNIASSDEILCCV
ncbi:MAG: hypothetical protein ACI9T7_000063 [Oleiphilaceae bacterium]|jgi:hypothetical protein